MIFNYQKILKENNINADELPKNIKIILNSIRGKEKGITMREKGGKNVSDKQLSAIKEEDDAAVEAINEYLEKKKAGSGSDDAAKKEAERLKKEAAEKEERERKEKETKGAAGAGEKKTDPKAIEIEKELKALIEENKTELSLEELKKSAPTTYSIIFEAYKKGHQNGVHTSRFKIEESETEPEKFTISKS